MRRTVARLIVIAPLSLLLAACGTELERRNAYDQLTDVESQATGGLTGRIRLEGEADYAGVDVRVDGPVQGSVATGSDGSFAINQLIPGSYKVVLSSRGFAEVTYPTVTVGLATTMVMDTVELALREATVLGSVRSTDPNLVRPAGSVVRVVRVASPRSAALAPAYAPSASDSTGFDPIQAQAIVGNDGTFVLRDIGAGTYALTLVGEGAAAVGSEFTITGDTAEVDLGELTLNPLTGSLVVSGTLGTGLSSSTYTVTRTVQLQLLGFNASSMQVGEQSSGVCQYDAVESYAVDRGFTLSAGDGIKTVCVRYLSASGNQTADITRTITLDTLQPALTSVVLDNTADKSASLSGSVALAISATDGGSGLAGVRVGNSLPQAQAAALLNPDTTDSWVLAAPVGAGQSGSRVVTVLAVDQAGNTSAPMTDAIEYDTVAPTGSVAFAASVTSSTLVTLATTYGSDTVEMALTRGSSCSSSVWESVTPVAAWSLAPGETLQTIAVQFRDDAGNVSACYTDQIELDVLPPDPPALQVFDTTGDGFAYSADDIELRWSKPTGTAYYELQRLISGLDDGFVFVAQLSHPQDTYVDTVTQPGYSYYYRVRAIDALHNASAWSVVVDALPFEPIGQIGWIMNEGAMQFNFAPNPGVFGITGTYEYLESDAWLNTFALAANQTTWIRPSAFTVEPFEESLTLRTANQDSSLVYDSTFELPKSHRSEVIAASATLSGTSIVAIDAYDRPHAMWTDGSGFHYSYLSGNTWYSSVVPNTTGGLTLGDFALDNGTTPHFVYRNGNVVYYGKRSSSVISDTFETTYKQQHWQSPTCAAIATDANSEFSGTQSLRIAGGGIVQNALPLAPLTAQSQLYFNYRFQRGDGTPDGPESGDLLAFEYYNGSTWVAVQTHSHTAGTTTGWTYAGGSLPANATSVRFRNYSDGGCAADYYFVEDFNLYGSSLMWITWTVESLPGGLPRLALDSSKNAHIVYGRTLPETRHLTNATGSWVAQQAYNANYSYDQFDITIDGSDRIHLIGSVGSGDVYHSIRTSGIWAAAALVYNTTVFFNYFDAAAGIQNKLSVCFRDYSNNIIYRGNYNGASWSFASTGLGSYTPCAVSALTTSRDAATAHASRTISGVGIGGNLSIVDSNVGVARTLDQLKPVSAFDALSDSLGASHIVHYGSTENALLHSTFHRATNSVTTQPWTRYNLTSAGILSKVIHLEAYNGQHILYSDGGATYHAWDTGDGWKSEFVSNTSAVLHATITWDGKIHMCGFGDFDYRLVYDTNETGVWTDEEVVSGDNDAIDCRIGLSGGVVYIVYKNDAGNSDVPYLVSGNAGGWSSPAAIHYAIGPTFNMAVDEDEYIHLVYENTSGFQPQLETCEITQGCLATADPILSQAIASQAIDVDTRYSGDLHVAYRRSADGTLWYARRLYGDWTHTQITTTGDAGQRVYLAIDKNDQLHMLYLNSMRLGYATNAAGFWQSTILAGPGTGDTDFGNFGLSFDSKNYATASWVSEYSSVPVMLRGNFAGSLAAASTARTTPF